MYNLGNLLDFSMHHYSLVSPQPPSLTGKSTVELRGVLNWVSSGSYGWGSKKNIVLTTHYDNDLSTYICHIRSASSASWGGARSLELGRGRGGEGRGGEGRGGEGRGGGRGGGGEGRGGEGEGEGEGEGRGGEEGGEGRKRREGNCNK